MNTLLLQRSDIVRLLDPAALIPVMRDAFSHYSLQRGIAGQRFFSHLDGPGDMMILAPGLSPGIPAYTVKVHAKYPEQKPGIRGVLLLHDLDSGGLLAIMDSTYITAVRTGLGAALATDILARPDAVRVAVIGAGVQGMFQLRYLAMLRTLERVDVYDTCAAQARRYSDIMAAELNLPVVPCATLTAALAQADIVLSATWSIEPFLFPEMVQAGSHITTLGADQPGEAEVAPELIRQALFVCDDRDLALAMGAIGGAGLDKQWIDAELGEVIAGIRPGRSDPRQVTIYGAVGLPFQDLVTAWQVYQSAQQSGMNRGFDFLA